MSSTNPGHKQQFIDDYLTSYYSVSELAERFAIIRKTAHKWINRVGERGPCERLPGAVMRTSICRVN